MNKCLFIGRMTKNPDLSYTTQNTAFSRFTLAVDRPIKREGQPTADFVSCVAFGKTAETIAKYLAKGSKIAIEGRWSTGSYTNQNGNKVYTNDCTVERMEFVESKKDGNTSTTQGEYRPMEVPDGFSEVEPEELPF